MTSPSRGRQPTRNDVEAKDVLLRQLRTALDILRELDPASVTTLGGECSVSLAPFSHLLSRYGDALAIVWVDSHPDMGTGATEYSGFHATVVSALTGHGAPDVLDALPATTEPSRVVLEGMHDWPDATLPAVAAQWGLTVFSPDALRSGSGELLDWLAQTGASKVAIHFDVDTSPASLVGVPMR